MIFHKFGNWLFKMIPPRVWEDQINPNRKKLLLIGSFLAYGILGALIIVLILSSLEVFYSFEHLDRKYESIGILRLGYEDVGEDKLLYWNISQLEFLLLLGQVIGFILIFIYFVTKLISEETDYFYWVSLILNITLIISWLIIGGIIKTPGGVQITYFPDEAHFPTEVFLLVYAILLTGSILLHWGKMDIQQSYSLLEEEERNEEIFQLIKKLKQAALPIGNVKRELKANSEQ